NCGFETTEDCFFENSQPSQRRKRTTQEILLADNFDWIFGKSGPTPSSRTGPSSAIVGVRYAYIEASSPRASGERAVIRTTNTFRETLQCISFYYHMFGSASGMGTLNVYYSSSSGHVQNIFTKSGNQGDQWLLEAVEIPPTSGLVIYIEGIRGKSYKSDIAIDAVTVTEGNCGCTANPCH
ncbi:MAM domain-containing glycosylphosphatidylinositol anchor protein 1-like, partial [Saccostrea cucullata]|uniref:MAM domain-containing glycosylphosphatidylinositol anchor protein 1-like n=1 Tax=Saccostrea cuccullata TaxID=36930 RepID=UPI002ED321EA